MYTIGFLLLTSVALINCVTILTDTDSSSTTIGVDLNETTITTTTTRLTTVNFKPILTNNETKEEILAENHENQTIPNFAADNRKFVVSSNETLINLQKTTGGGGLTLPLTLIIIVIGAVFVIIIIIISALFVMRRRFSKWRLNVVNTNGSSGSNGSNGGNASDEVDDGKGNNALISKQQQEECTKTSSSSNEESTTVTSNDNGHSNQAVSTSQSADTIQIENEINQAISEINAATNENVETTKLLNNEQQQTQQEQQQQQQQQQQELIEDIDETKKSTVKLNADIEKQPLNHE